MKKVFYTRETSSNGKVRYVPVAEYDSYYMDSFPKGSHLVMCHPGGTTRRFNIDPNYAAMIAAGRVAEDAISRAFLKALELKPQQRPLTETQKALWRALSHSFNREDFMLMRPSVRDAAEAGVKAMEAEADKLLQHPTVKLAFEKFLMVCELAKNNKNEAS